MLNLLWLFSYIVVLPQKVSIPCTFPLLYDTIYSNAIYSLRANKVISSSSSIGIEFDDLRGSHHHFHYEIIHLDKNWNRDDLKEQDYIIGFNHSEITQFAYSKNRNQNYTSYLLAIPNANFSPKISGNYILHVYELNTLGEKVYYFTRRFMVSENILPLSSVLSIPRSPLKLRTHHEIEVNLNTTDFKIREPKNEISLRVMQNDRWSSIVTCTQNNREKPYSLGFVYPDILTFPAGKEFRNFDIRSLDLRTRYVKKIVEYEDEIVILLNKEKPRNHLNFNGEEDFNGNSLFQSFERSDYSGEYVWVEFTLIMPELSNQEVFIYGAFADWQCKDQYKLKYNATAGAYLGSVYLKQGYYNYVYAIRASNGDIITSPIEGDWSETENSYQTMVYYRPFGARYDRLIAYRSISHHYSR